MAKDLYSTLGVSRTESLHGIREAFRKLAKRYHPDHAGQQGTLKFQEILNAYEVLSDPEKRKRYNERLPGRSADSEPIVVTRRSSSRTPPPPPTSVRSLRSHFSTPSRLTRSCAPAGKAPRPTASTFR